MRTEEAAYTIHLTNQVWWKRLIDVQFPYRCHLLSLHLGRVLEIGCGVGRNLINLDMGVGIDHNPTSVNVAKQRGLIAYTPDEFLRSEYAKPKGFETLLVAHVLEHMTAAEAKGLLSTYMPYLVNHGRLVIITPQEAGFASDTTHITMMDHRLVAQILEASGAKVSAQYSFPFPRIVGRVFKYNEFVSIGILEKSNLDSNVPPSLRHSRSSLFSNKATMEQEL